MVVLLIQLIDWVFFFYSLAFFIRTLLPWLRVDYYHPVARFLIQITEPLLVPLRRYIPPVGGWDVTPMVAMIIVWIVERMLKTLIVILFS